MPKEKTLKTPDTIGTPSGSIQVELSTRFLEHFSEQLYSSPQKAFEELISNGWDAAAECVDVRVAENLSAASATLSVLDNGISMDEQGLRDLWHIAFSPKEGQPVQNGRPVIGKFGIGKLATYVLAGKLTYICKASDQVIRRVTMDYAAIDKKRAGAGDRLISETSLPLYVVTEDDVCSALESVSDGDAIWDLIKKGVPAPAATVVGDEFGGSPTKLSKPAPGTWTLVVLSDLKPAGRDLKIGHLRRMLEAALPFGSEMAIVLNGELLTSSKIDKPTLADWIIGSDLGISTIEIELESREPDAVNLPQSNGNAAEPVEVIHLKIHKSPPAIEIPGIGLVTGRVRLFQERISGGKSEERGASNGFHINVLGRVVNQKDPSFGEENLSHAAWARFRMTVRADGLNPFLTINREQLQETRELKVFRAFLRKAFNKARTLYDTDESAGLTAGGDVLVKSLGVLSLNPLRNVVSEALESQPALPDLFDNTGVTDRPAALKAWRESTAENISNALGAVKYEALDDETLVKFRLTDNSIVVNKNHPFVLEHSRTKAEKELLRTVAMVNFLTDVYSLDAGIEAKLLDSIREYRDRIMRFRALQSRRSGTYIARLLLQTQHDSANSKRFEVVLSDALRYLGYHIKDLAKSGEPEGIASAFALPTLATPTQEVPHPPLYSFSFDAKTSKHDSARTGNISLDAVVEHRTRYHADYALVVAPGFTGRAICTRCQQQKVTPMTARDLGRLLEFTVEYGAIPLTRLRSVFTLYDPAKVTEWVSALEQELKQQRPLTIDIFLKALNRLKGKVPDVLPAGVIAYECRDKLGAVTVKDDDVIALARGLSILIPDLVGIDGDKVVVNASSTRVAEAVATQLEKLRSETPVEQDEP